MLKKKIRGIVTGIERTGEFKVDENNVRWEKCILTVRLKGFSKRTPDLELPEHLKDREVKIVRWCAFEWHYQVNVPITLTFDETEKILKGEAKQLCS
ncbi:MAG: hypothetical protein B6U94_02755 [Thermofilum sp. ex4484_79]|nr:MAG: hypothetical protein B6U94_02755 [Thermofilum sp. ex4484_79]